MANADTDTSFSPQQRHRVGQSTAGRYALAIRSLVGGTERRASQDQ